MPDAQTEDIWRAGEAIFALLEEEVAMFFSGGISGGCAFFHLV